MNISKNGRFIFGLILLFSITLFLGTEKSGCFDCDISDNANITMVNNSFTAYKFIISGTTSAEKVVQGGASLKLYVEAGKYTVYSWGNPPYYRTKGKTWKFSLEAGEGRTLFQE